MKTSQYGIVALAALALALSPSLLQAQHVHYTSGHAQQVSFHDRTPHAHDHGSVAHH